MAKNRCSQWQLCTLLIRNVLNCTRAPRWWTNSELASIISNVRRLVKEQIPIGAGTPMEGTNCREPTTGFEVTIRCVSLWSFVISNGSFTILPLKASNTRRFLSLPMDRGSLVILVRLRPRKRKLNKPNTSFGNLSIELSVRSKTDNNLADLDIVVSEVKVVEFFKSSKERRCGAWPAICAISPLWTDKRRASPIRWVLEWLKAMQNGCSRALERARTQRTSCIWNSLTHPDSFLFITNNRHRLTSSVK